MGLPRYHEQPVLLLMYRTIQNLEFIDRNKDHGGPFEVTQLVNSFLAVVAHPWDQLLDKHELKQVRVESRTFRECGFPAFPSLPVEGAQPDVSNAGELLRRLRHGMAHGNMELLGRKDLRRLRQTGTLPRVQEHEIAGLMIWNQASEAAPITWRTALDVHEIRQGLDGMMRLCEKRNLWKEEVRIEQERRDAERGARRA